MAIRRHGLKPPRKTKPPPSRLKLVKRPRRRKKMKAATIAGILETAHLTVHGIHRVRRTYEVVARRVERSERELTRGPGAIYYQVGQTVELEDLDIPDDAISELEGEIHDIMESTGLDIMGEAVDIVPVDTGHLRESLWYEVEDPDLSLTVGDNADYAVYVEDGTYKMLGRPFLRLAIMGNEAEMEAEIDGAIATMLDEQAQNEDAGILLPGEGEADVEVETSLIVTGL